MAKKYCRYGVKHFSINQSINQRGINTNDEIGLVANQIYELWNSTIFVPLDPKQK